MYILTNGVYSFLEKKKNGWSYPPMSFTYSSRNISSFNHLFSLLIIATIHSIGKWQMPKVWRKPLINLQRMKDDISVEWYVKRSFSPSTIEELEKLSLLTHKNSYTFAIINIPYYLTIERLLTFKNNIKYIQVKSQI